MLGLAIASAVFVSIAILIHIYIWVLESFLWDTPRGLKTFNMSQEKANITREMAANQGLYNLMLALVAFVGIVLLFVKYEQTGAALIFAGAGSMAVAGIYLFITAKDKRKPACIQCLPPLIGIILLIIYLAI